MGQLLQKYTCWLREANYRFEWPNYVSVVGGLLGVVAVSAFFLCAGTVDFVRLPNQAQTTGLLGAEFHTPMALALSGAGLALGSASLFITILALRLK